MGSRSSFGSQGFAVSFTAWCAPRWKAPPLQYCAVTMLGMAPVLASAGAAVVGCPAAKTRPESRPAAFACANFMSSSASRPTGVGEFVSRKSCVAFSSSVARGPSTPITLIAMPRASSSSSAWCQPTPFEKRTHTGFGPCPSAKIPKRVRGSRSGAGAIVPYTQPCAFAWKPRATGSPREAVCARWSAWIWAANARKRAASSAQLPRQYSVFMDSAPGTGGSCGPSGASFGRTRRTAGGGATACTPEQATRATEDAPKRALVRRERPMDRARLAKPRRAPPGDHAPGRADPSAMTDS
jgi:hypothetical protein